MGCNSCKKNQTCDKCAPKARYCGVDLACLGVIKGESYDSILQKLNTLFCTEIEGTTYVFDDNELCESTGFTVTQIQGDVEEVIFEYCQECCENTLDQYLIDAKGDLSVFAGDTPIWINILGVSYINEPEYEVQELGKYKVVLEEQISGEEDSKYLIGLGINSNPPVFAPYSEFNSNVTTNVVMGTNYYKKTHVFTSNLQIGDEVSVWIKVLVGGVNLDTDLRLTFEKM